MATKTTKVYRIRSSNNGNSLGCVYAKTELEAVTIFLTDCDIFSKDDIYVQELGQ